MRRWPPRSTCWTSRASRSWRIDGDPGRHGRAGHRGRRPGDLPGRGGAHAVPRARAGHRRPGRTLSAARDARRALDLVARAGRAAGPRAGPRGRRRSRSSSRRRRARSSALESLASTMHLALERLDVGEIMVERRSERRLRLMLQYASDVICILDHDLTIVHVTPAVEPIVGLPAPELLGMNWLEIVTDADREAARDLVSLAQGGRPARGEVRLDSEDGSIRHVDAVVTEVIDEDLMGFVVTCHDITERHQLEEQLTHQAFHDALTGLANRALFRDRLGHAMARARGHRRLRRAVHRPRRLQDGQRQPRPRGRRRAAPRDDRPAAALPARRRHRRPARWRRVRDPARGRRGRRPLHRHRPTDCSRRCPQPFEIGGTEVTTGASIGIAVGQAGPASPEDLMRNADLALYDAKNAGKNRYAVFAPTMHEAALARLSLTSDLRHAIERGELVVFYQPLVDLGLGEDHRPRGPGPLGAPHPRHAAARPVHLARRGDRADRAARPDGPAHRAAGHRRAGSATTTPTASCTSR